MDYDNETDSTPAGGLKLMTVFIIVLALHVIVIGGISAYHYFSHASGDVLASETETAPGFGEEDFAGDFDEEPVSRTELSPGRTAAAPAPAPVPPVMPDPEAPGRLSPRDMMAMRSHTPALAPAPAPAPVPAPESVPAPTETVATVVEETTETVVAEVPAGASSEYVVQKGDTLWGIARKYDMHVKDLKELNGLTNDMVRIGQKLTVPAPQIAGAAPAPAPAPVPAATPAPVPAPVAVAVEQETTEVVAVEAEPGTIVYGQTDMDLPAPEPAPAPAPAVASAGEPTVYKVAPGDTLWRIARKFKTTANAIMAANGIDDPKLLRAGAKLVIPDQAQASAKPAGSPTTESRVAAPAPLTDIVLNN